MEPVKLSREQLYELVWKSPLSAIIKTLPITLQQLKEICNDMEVPLPSNGYWTKLRFGKIENRIELSKDYSGEPFAVLRQRIDGAKILITEKELFQERIKKEVEPLLQVPRQLIDPDPRIVRAQRILTEVTPYSRDEVMRSCYGELDISVSKSNIDRALRIMDTLVKCFNARGYRTIQNDRFTTVYIREVSQRVSLREITRKVPGKNQWPEYDFEPTGVLAIKVGYIGEWKDGRLPIQEQLSKIIAKMEWHAEDLHSIWAENKKQKDEKDAIARRKQEERQRKVDELERFKNLLQEAERWQKSKLLRDYIRAATADESLGGAIEQKNEWLNWAARKADWYDPKINAEDELLKEVDKNELILSSQIYC